MRDQVELNYVLNQLKIITPYGRELLRNLKAYKISETDILKATLEDLQLVKESLVKFPQLHNKLEGEFLRIKDIRGSIKRCKNQEVLDDIQLFEIKVFSLYSQEIRRHYRAMGLTIEGVDLQDLETIIEILDPEKKRFATFSIYDAYSEKLKAIREEKAKIEGLLYKEDDLKEIEVLKIKRLQLVDAEHLEEEKIRLQLSQDLAPYMEVLEGNIAAIGKLDFTIGKAKYAEEKGCTKPLFHESIGFEMIGGYHPYIQDLLEKQGQTFTKIDINLVAGTNAITGPNMGGKSVAVKTIGLNGLLAHLGFFVFADQLQLSPFDFIHLLSNDQESLNGGLSTFGGEVLKLKEYLIDIKRSRGLVLIDELASGTNPAEGRGLVKSVMEYLKAFDTISLFITHFDGVVGKEINHYQVTGLKHVDFKKLISAGNYDSSYGLEMIRKLMDYRLQPLKDDQRIPRDALNISTLLGLDPKIIEIAEKHFYEEVQFCGKETEKNA